MSAIGSKGLKYCMLRACSVGTVPFRSATVSIVKRGSFRFETEGNGPFVWGNGTEPFQPNRLLIVFRYL